MEPSVLEHAIEAASSLARDAGLVVEHAGVVHNSNAVGLRLLPCDTFARVAVAGREVAAFEIDVATQLQSLNAPVASLDPRTVATVHHRDGFAVTFWTHHRTWSPVVAPGGYAEALHRLHAALRRVRVDAPHAMERVSEALAVVRSPARSPGLADADRSLLLGTLTQAGTVVLEGAAPHQLVHGEPHPGNVLDARPRPLFVDLETVCVGPVEFDLAHVPQDVAALYPDVDQALLHESRRLVLAMVCAWRWDAGDEFPHGRQHGLEILRLLRAGPPWPTLAELTVD